MLAPGFLFRPTDTQLVNYYLKRKVLGKKFWFETIAEVNIYKYAPWDLPYKSCINNGDLKWYFFCPVEKKYASSMRLIRATEYGYWKVTGKDSPIYHNKKVVGMMKTLVFHQGKGSRRDQTDWVMHEYRLEDKDLGEKGIVQDAYVLCVVFQKDGPGAQYEVPPREEDYIAFAFATAPFVPQSQCLGSSVEPSYSDTLDMILDDVTIFMGSPQLSDDSILSMLAFFTEESSIDAPKKEDDFLLLVNASEFLEAPEFSLDDEGDDILSMLSTFIEHDDSAPTSREAPQLSDDSILSMLAIFTEESTIDNPEMEDDFSLLVNASDFMEAPEFSLDDEGDDILSMLSTFIEHDDATPTPMEPPQLSDNNILSMLEIFT
ncbi:hypothetical protein CRYUN_Cryun29cG0094900 [Craigia yunnanensis]